MTRSSLLIAVLLLGCTLNAPGAFTRETNHKNAAATTHTQASPLPGHTGYSDIAGRINAVFIYSVKDGVLRTQAYTKDDVKAGKPFQVDGYVCGIVVLCEEEMAASVEGQQMSPIRMNADGTFSLKYFGTLRPEDLALYKFAKTYYEKAGLRSKETKRGEAFLEGGYSFFPRVSGDAVNPADRFHITLTSNGKTFDLPVQHRGSSPFCTIYSKPKVKENELTFRYIGSDLDRLKREIPDLDNRLRAIAEGVDKVESTFGMDLVNTVNIIDYNDIHNAVTCDEGYEIWLYVRAVKSEPVDELKAMATHETIHKYVSQNRFAYHSTVRELFADMKGYDALSHERFFIMTAGFVPQNNTGVDHAKSPLFAFVNEKNFLKGMKGGHSHANVDEFCTSFIHSVLFVDLLKGNLEQPVIFPAVGDGIRLLSHEEKGEVLDTYIRTIETFIKALGTTGNGSSTPSGDLSHEFLREAHKKVKQIREEWRSSPGGFQPTSVQHVYYR